MTEDTATSRPAPRPRRKHAASGARILTAGLAAGAGLGLVGAMTASAQSAGPPTADASVRRVVVLDGTSATGVADPAATTSTPSTVGTKPLPLPPRSDVRPTAPVTQSQGS